MEKAGIEYMLSPHVGLGLEIVDLITIMNTPDVATATGWSTRPHESDGFNGFVNLGVTAGLRFYFP